MAIIRPVVIAVTCVGLFLILESSKLPKATALSYNRNRMDDQRVHTRRNDMMQRARDENNFQNVWPVYDPEIEPEQQAVVLYDGIDDDMNNFFEILTEKRGGISQFENQALPDNSCEYTNVVEDYGKGVFPRRVDGKKCRSEQSSTCNPPFKCQEVLYELPFLRSKVTNDYVSELKNLETFAYLVPTRLRFNWYAEYRNVSVGCQCLKAYVETKISAK